nr:reverse transcriptase domain-containing protein [Tanacetum cinerariifolium]
MHKKRDFQWTAKAKSAFKQKKNSIAELCMLTTPKEKEELIIYLAAAKEAVSAVPMTKGWEANAHLLCQSCITGPRNQLHSDGKVDTCPNSRVVANQVNGTYIAKEPGMIKYLEKVKAHTSTFKEFFIKQVPRGENKKANALSKIASISFAHLSKQVLMEELKEKSIDEKEVLAVVEEEGGAWMTPIHEYLVEEILPEEKKKARAIRRKTKRSWQGQVPDSSNQLLHQMDRRKPVFRDNPFKYWCEKLCIRQCFASIKHPQANGLVERANRSLGEGIKAINRETPFSLTYEMKAVILVEIGMPTLRTAKVDMIKYNEALRINLDLLEEKREQAAIQEAKSKAKMEKYYNTRVRNTSFRTSDFVYQNNEASHAEEGGKLRPKWEKPYEVMEALGRGAYKLRGRNGSILP